MARPCTPSTPPTRWSGRRARSRRSATTSCSRRPARSTPPTSGSRRERTRRARPRWSRPTGPTAAPMRSSWRGGWTSRAAGWRRPSVSARRSPFQYAALRVIPRVERGEAVNAGVVLFCRPLRFLGARIDLDEALLAALSPKCDPTEVRAQLELIEHIAPGESQGGATAELPQSERFHWRGAPASTIVQAGPVHTGLTEDPQRDLDKLFAKLVER